MSQLIQNPTPLELAEFIIDVACCFGSDRVSATNEQSQEISIGIKDLSFVGEFVSHKDRKIQFLDKWFLLRDLDKVFNVWNIDTSIHEWQLRADAIFLRVPDLGYFHAKSSAKPLDDKPQKRLEPPNLEQYAGQDFIYFIRAKALGFIKIGYSSNVAKRIKSLDTGSPDTLELIKVIPGGQEMEHKIHQFFDDIRVKGEWFQPDSKLLNYIEKL